MAELADDRRWDNDTRGHGIADGGWIAPDVRRLLAALTEPDWVAENPDQHLLPRLREACQAAASPWNGRIPSRACTGSGPTPSP